MIQYIIVLYSCSIYSCVISIPVLETTVYSIVPQKMDYTGLPHLRTFFIIRNSLIRYRITIICLLV